MANTDLPRLAELMTQYKLLGPSDNDKRNEILDEMQDAAGLAGKMVTDKDILKKAELLLRA